MELLKKNWAYATNLDFLIPIILARKCCWASLFQSMTGSNNLNLKYQISDCKDIMFIKFEFVAMTPFHCKEKVKKRYRNGFWKKVLTLILYLNMVLFVLQTFTNN